MDGKTEIICDCIYCGSDNVQASDANMGYCGDLWHVICFDCFAAGPEAGSKERAITEWNKPYIINARGKKFPELEDV